MFQATEEPRTKKKVANSNHGVTRGNKNQTKFKKHSVQQYQVCVSAFPKTVLNT